MQFSRSHRRHHAERLKRNRYKESLRYSTSSPDWALWFSRKRLHTACMCSCSTCGNPRRHYGNKAEARTLQERRPWE